MYFSLIIPVAPIFPLGPSTPGNPLLPGDPRQINRFKLNLSYELK